MTDATPARGLRRLSLRLRVVYLAPVLALVALSAWAFASPVGSSPDDDYHLASIWCANDQRTDLCAPSPVRDEWRLVLPGLTSAPCYVADENASAACQEWLEEPAPTLAAAHGNWIGAYPPVYYAAMNVFASTDIQASALAMRVANVAVFVLLTTSLALLLPRELRTPLLAGWAITTVPLGGFLIASNNPGSWAVIGVGLSWIAALGWFRTGGRRAWVLGAVTALGVVMAAGARTDAAIYAILGLGIASFLAFERSRAFALKLVLPVALAIVAFVFYRMSGYSAIALFGLTGATPDSGDRDPASVLAFNVVSIPRLWTGVFGSWGLGWKMESWPGFAMVEFAALVVFVGLVSLGIRHLRARRAIMVVALVATLYVLPIYILTVGSSVVGENVQPRYILPLVVVLGGLLLLGSGSRPLAPGRWHVIPAIVLLAGAHTIALYGNLRRYVTGFDIERLSLESGAEWWWTGLPVGPTFVWIVGSLAFAATLTVLGVAWLRESRRGEAVA